MFALVNPERHIPDRFAGVDNKKSSLNHIAFEIDEANYESEQQRLKGLGLEIQTTELPRCQGDFLQ